MCLPYKLAEVRSDGVHENKHGVNVRVNAGGVRFVVFCHHVGFANGDQLVESVLNHVFVLHFRVSFVAENADALQFIFENKVPFVSLFVFIVSILNLADS